MNDAWPTWATAALAGSMLFSVAAGFYGLNVLWGIWALKRWAGRNNLKVLERQVRHVRRGPFLFSWGYGGGEVVFRLRVEGADGQIATGWAACSTAMGRYAQRVRTQWDQNQGFPVICDVPIASQAGRSGEWGDND